MMNLLSLRSHSKHTTLYEKLNFLVLHHLQMLRIINYLLGGSSLAGANSPNRLISKHDLAPVLYIVCERRM